MILGGWRISWFIWRQEDRRKDALARTMIALASGGTGMVEDNPGFQLID